MLQSLFANLVRSPRLQKVMLVILKFLRGLFV